MKTYMAKPGEVDRDWYVVDARDQVLGRLASKIAHVLRGKHKPTYTPHMDAGDFVIVVNADKVKLTGNKLKNKMYRWHTGYPGGLKEMSYEKLMAKKPEEAIISAVQGMLPHNKLGRKLIKKLKVYRGPEHPHQAQQPKELEL
ncbi:MAG: 50S ribosomal protein L13 [Halanaerobium sp.]|nr:50S ribosomal protein L13 [Halanaerobium sp.]